MSNSAAASHPPQTLDLLAPQELQIARLAAEGLSNREIGQQLYLSHRTISNHLYRIFPKLGITSRAELAAVVGPPRVRCRRPDQAMESQTTRLLLP